VGHPLIHLGYAYEMNNREIAMEALGLTAVQYNFLHQYLDDPSYTKPSPVASGPPAALLATLAADSRFDGLFPSPGYDNIQPLFDRHEALVLEYWNAWDVDADPTAQFRASQEAAVDLLVATVPPGTHAYNFFVVHLLTTSHAVRILLPFVPARFHVALVRSWWLLVLAVYIAELRPAVDPDYVPRDLKGKGWGYVEQQAIESRWRTDAHFVKGESAPGVDDGLLLTRYSGARHKRGGADMGRCPRTVPGCRRAVRRRFRGLGPLDNHDCGSERQPPFCRVTQWCTSAVDRCQHGPSTLPCRLSISSRSVVSPIPPFSRSCLPSRPSSLRPIPSRVP